jgi:SAM-dependent methyltransferase
MTTSKDYWQKRYASGRNSGAGSYGQNAIYKSKIINQIINKYNITSAIEFGCGDGNNALLYNIEKYTGLDVSSKAIELCNARHIRDDEINKKQFYTMDHWNPRESAELTMSIEVLFHLTEDDIYEAYLNELCGYSNKYVLIFSSNETNPNTASHVKHRKFTDDLFNLKLIEKIETDRNKYDMFSDFYLYEKVL